MSKSIKRNNKYFSEESEYHDDYEEHRNHLKEKRIRSALKSKNINALFDLMEDR